MVIAGAVAKWYFTMNKKDDLPLAPVSQSFMRTVRYHMGSVALGSLIIAIVQFVRLVLEYIDRKTKAAQVRAVLCVCACARATGRRDAAAATGFDS